MPGACSVLRLGLAGGSQRDRVVSDGRIHKGTQCLWNLMDLTNLAEQGRTHGRACGFWLGHTQSLKRRWECLGPPREKLQMSDSELISS